MADPALHKVTATICEGCLKAEGEMCNTPGCIFIRQRPPEFPVDLDQVHVAQAEAQPRKDES